LPLSERLRVLNFVLHTGEGTRGWAGVLLLTTLGMVFLSFTGFQMVAQKWRLKKHQVMPTDDAEIIVLVGSETGHTWRFADALEDAFAEKKIKVNTLGMENIPKISGHKTVFFLTSTYGDGDAPENAKGVIKQLKAQFSNAQSVQFRVWLNAISWLLFFCRNPSQSSSCA
jgi:sulfite reductase (NADPH) flavoprotein alpha-component